MTARVLAPGCDPDLDRMVAKLVLGPTDDEVGHVGDAFLGCDPEPQRLVLG
jgi:hypothetical protein